MKYVLHVYYMPQILSERIVEDLKEGWKLHGVTFVDNKGKYCQAMTYEEPAQDKGVDPDNITWPYV